jgi:hypothetical protein
MSSPRTRAAKVFGGAAVMVMIENMGAAAGPRFQNPASPVPRS